MSREHQEPLTTMPTPDQERSGFWSDRSLEIIGSLEQLIALGDLLNAAGDADLNVSTLEKLGTLIQEKAERIKDLVEEEWESQKNRNRQ